MVSEYLYIPLIAWAVAQLIKFSIAIFKGQYKPSLLFSSGGMPSVHSATVASLATVALIEGGPSSPLFGITGVFAAIVMYDSLGVRRAAGEQAKVLNLLIEDLSANGAVKTPKKYGHLKEILGHRPLEVAVGVVLGVILTAIIMGNVLLAKATWLLAVPSSTARVSLIIIAAVLVLSAGLVLILSTRRGSRKLARYKPFIKQIFLANVVVALLLGICVFLQYQNVSPYNTWLLVLIVFMALFFWHASLWYILLIDGKLLASLADMSSQVRKQKWIKRKQKPVRLRGRVGKKGKK
jgi:acid phosphatase family membrane protein YuiD